jgi:hypothetical protein
VDVAHCESSRCAQTAMSSDAKLAKLVREADLLGSLITTLTGLQVGIAPLSDMMDVCFELV